MPSTSGETAQACGRPVGRVRRVPVWAMSLTLVVLALVAPIWASGAPSAVAKGDDVCPESNDTFQAACFLGTDSDALGFISRGDDVDAYRFEVRDYDARVQVSLPDRPLPYRLSLANWNGDIIQSGGGGTLQASLTLPGSYYVFVDSGSGQSSETAPYRIAYTVTYPTQSVPTVLYTSEFRGGPRDIFPESGTNTHSDEDGDYTIDQGRITIAMRVSGTPDEPTSAKFYLSPDPPDSGPTVDDFTMVIDARMVGETEAGYSVLFRFIDSDNYYQAEINLKDQQVALTKLVDGELYDVTDWIDAPNLRVDGVNRTVIRCVGDEIRLTVNGRELARERDDTFTRGLVGYGAMTYGDPPTVNFDNILVTTPTRR
jgi:hypothetical protein